MFGFNSEQVNTWLQEGIEEGQKEASKKIADARQRLSKQGDQMQERTESMIEPIVLELGRILGRLRAIGQAAKQDLGNTEESVHDGTTGCECASEAPAEGGDSANDEESDS
jgi:hypothetical protein